MVFEGRFTAPVFIAFLRRLARQRRRKVFVIADRHPVHESPTIVSGAPAPHSLLGGSLLGGAPPHTLRLLRGRHDRNTFLRPPTVIPGGGGVSPSLAQRAKPILAQVYFAISQPEPPLPSAEYKRLIVEGAKYWRLPEDYVRRLEAIETQKA
ncbi:MAG: gamma-glutamylcyclotransferase [Candidatus Rokubacteria bacterium]|nr:gamma-glutamylcyclotransferase [Candidatus Rokubacteria bacterium]